MLSAEPTPPPGGGGDDVIIYDKSTLKKTAFLIYATSMATFAGFGLAYAKARKRGGHDALHDEGVRLAVRALGYGTLLSVSGMGLLTGVVCASLGVRSPKEFGAKMKELLPTKDGKFAHKFDNWVTKFDKKPDDEKWREEFK